MQSIPTVSSFATQPAESVSALRTSSLGFTFLSDAMKEGRAESPLAKDASAMGHQNINVHVRAYERCTAFASPNKSQDTVKPSCCQIGSSGRSASRRAELLRITQRRP